MARVRNNQGHRSKILNVFMRPYLEQENTQEREGYLQARETVKPLQDKTWKLAEKIVRRHYTDEDVKMAYHLQNKFDNVNTIAKRNMLATMMNKTTSTSQSILIFV